MTNEMDLKYLPTFCVGFVLENRQMASLQKQMYLLNHSWKTIAEYNIHPSIHP